MAACQGGQSKFKFDFADDEKLDTVMARMRSMNNKPTSSSGKIVRVNRSLVKGREIASDDTRRVRSPRKRHVATTDLAFSYYVSIGGAVAGFHLKENLTGVTRVEYRGKLQITPVAMTMDPDKKPRSPIRWEQRPKNIPENWFSSARPRSPYINKGILYAELKNKAGAWVARAHVVPKKIAIVNLGGTFAFKNEQAVQEEVKVSKRLIAYKDNRHQDVWIGGNNIHGKGFQQWGVRIGNWWIMQKGEEGTNLQKYPANSMKKSTLWKRVGTTTCDPNWLVKGFKTKYQEECPDYQFETHNCKHISASVLIAIGLECPFWPLAEKFAKVSLSNINFTQAPKSFISVKALRLFTLKDEQKE